MKSVLLPIPPDPSQGVIENPWNQLLAAKHYAVKGAFRFAMSTECDPATGEPKVSRVVQSKQLKFIVINAATAGDNIIIPALAGEKQVFEMVIWNVAQQTIRFTQGGATAPNVQTLLQLTQFSATTGFTLGFNGSFDQAHFDLDNGQPLVMNLSAGTQVDGFIRYRVRNGT